MKHLDNNKHMNEIEDDDSTVSYFDDLILEMNANATARQRRSFASSTSNDNDDSTVSTVASTVNDDYSYIWNDDIFDNLYYSSNGDNHGSVGRKVKRVRFGDTTVREYGVTVGACTPSNTGRCPMELTWEYFESYNIECNQDESMSNYKYKPLSTIERRERIAIVQGISNDEVKILEYEASISLIQETLEFLESSRHKLLYSMESPQLYHNEFSTNFSCHKKPLVGESNKFFRKIMIEEISLNPL